MGEIPANLKILMERNYQVAERDLNEYEEGFLTMMRTIRLPFLVKTNRIFYHDCLNTAKKFGRSFCSKIKTPNFFALYVILSGVKINEKFLWQVDKK